MASATVDSSVCNHQNHLHTESVPLIDLRLLSQSELLSLSLCSSSSSSALHRLQADTGDVSTPKIDRSVFNESAGSRKQTFSRLRLAPRSNNNNNIASSSSKSTPIFPHGTEQQPLDEENSHIISLLKSLFGSNSHSVENENENNNSLVSVPIIYNEYMCLPAANNAELKNFSIGIVDSSRGGIAVNQGVSSSKKRKRGRPRKNEDMNFSNDELVVRQHEEIENKPVVVARDNVVVENKEKEMVMVNKNGLVLDLTALGNVEDPYGEVLRRTTEGMQSKAELLAFLEGLGGEWGSARKKRRTVDASAFGDALPIGWKLLLCIKKNGGRVSLACRRYISPNGQQFVSCKEVSSYLRSFCGLQDVSQSNFGHMESRVQLSDKATSANAADLTLKDGKNQNDLICLTASHFTCKSTEIGEHPGAAQTGNKYKCHKCTMAFDEQDDFLQHLLSTHQRPAKRLGSGTFTNEEVIIKNGKYECQFCHKVFEERHRFNGHFGNHIKDYFRRLDASGGIITIQKNTEPASVKITPSVESTHTSIGIDGNSVAITSNIKANDENTEPESVEISPGVESTHTSIRIDGNLVAITSNIKANDEISSSIPYGEIKTNASVEAYYGKQDGVCNISIDNMEKMNEDTNDVAAEINAFSGAESALSNNDSSATHKPDDETDVLKCTANGIVNFGWQETSFQNCSHTAAAMDLACIGYNNTSQVAPCLVEKHNQDRGSKSDSLAPNALERMFNDDNIDNNSCSVTVNDMEIDDQDLVGKGEPITDCTNSCTTLEDAEANIKEQKSSECFVAGNTMGLSTSSVVETMQEKDSKWGLTGIENDMSTVYTGLVNKSKFDETDKFGCHINNAEPVEDNVTCNKQGQSYRSCLVFQSLNESMHLVENNMSGIPKCTISEPCQEKESEHVQDGNSEQRPSHNEQTQHDENSVNEVSCSIRSEEHKHKEAKTSCNGELRIALGHGCTEQDADVVPSTAQESFVLAGNQKTFSTIDNATSPHGATVDELRRIRGSVESSLCLTGSEPVQSADKNLDSAVSCAVQGEPELDNLENPWKKESGIRFSSLTGTFEHDVSFMWRTYEENDLLSGFADSSSQPVQTAGCFPPYDTVSDKGESELFGEKFGAISGFEGVKSGSMENMENNLQTSQVSSCADESRVISYDAEISQGFDSSTSLLEKEALPFLQKMQSKHHVPTVCVWCGNEFHCEPTESGVQTGTMGFICAVCSAKLSRQLNGQ